MVERQRASTGSPIAEVQSQGDGLESLVEDAGRLAEVEGVYASDLEEMGAINEMRVVAELIQREGRYVVHSASETP